MVNECQWNITCRDIGASNVVQVDTFLNEHGHSVDDVVVIGVNRISIYRVFLMCLCNLNARFTPLCANITLIPHFFEFCRY